MPNFWLWVYDHHPQLILVAEQDFKGNDELRDEAFLSFRTVQLSLDENN